MSDKRQWILRLVGLVLVLVLGFVYQQRALAWEAERKENAAVIAEVEQYNAKIEAMENGSKYVDGTFTGTGEGFGGDITLAVTIRDGVIEDISVVSAPGEDSVYFSSAVSMLEDMKTSQTSEIEAVSGATFSSLGLRDAVREALKQAEEAA